MDPIRRLVSGRKARFTDGELDLDLVKLTDRVILMGYPAAGLASLYRNQRKDVLRFLEQYAPQNKYRIVNLCPRYENSYDEKEFGEGRVLRFPFPDHFPPPLSLIPLCVRRANEWMQQDEENILIIHCKAGKGRSGTFGISYLLAQPGLPSAPAVPASSIVNPSIPAIDPSPVVGTPTDPPTMSEKIASILDFHTKRRMAPGTSSRGVSISSQRRWIGYWGRLLEGGDPRPKVVGGLGESRMRKVRLEWVKISGKGPSGVTRRLGGDRIAVQVFRYKDSLATSLRQRELALESTPTSAPWNDDDWDDKTDDMLVRVGGFTEATERSDRTPSPTSSGDEITAASPSPSRPDSGRATPAEDGDGHASDSPRTLLPHTAYLPPSNVDITPLDKEAAKAAAVEQGGISVDGDREVQLKLLLGKSGRKHGSLPAMAALGILWFIPSFESSPETTVNGIATLRIPAAEIDFLKPQAHIQEVEIGWRWVD